MADLVTTTNDKLRRMEAELKKTQAELKKTQADLNVANAAIEALRGAQAKSTMRIVNLEKACGQFEQDNVQLRVEKGKLARS